MSQVDKTTRTATTARTTRTVSMHATRIIASGEKSLLSLRSLVSLKSLLALAVLGVGLRALLALASCLAFGRQDRNCRRSPPRTIDTGLPKRFFLTATGRSSTSCERTRTGDVWNGRDSQTSRRLWWRQSFMPRTGTSVFIMALTGTLSPRESQVPPSEGRPGAPARSRCS